MPNPAMNPPRLPEAVAYLPETISVWTTIAVQPEFHPKKSMMNRVLSMSLIRLRCFSGSLLDHFLQTNPIDWGDAQNSALLAAIHAELQDHEQARFYQPAEPP